MGKRPLLCQPRLLALGLERCLLIQPEADARGIRSQQMATPTSLAIHADPILAYHSLSQPISDPILAVLRQAE